MKVHRYEELSVGGEERVKNVHGMHTESEMKWRRCPTHMCMSNAWSWSRGIWVMAFQGGREGRIVGGTVFNLEEEPVKVGRKKFRDAWVKDLWNILIIQWVEENAMPRFLFFTLPLHPYPLFSTDGICCRFSCIQWQKEVPQLLSSSSSWTTYPVWRRNPHWPFWVDRSGIHCSEWTQLLLCEWTKYDTLLVRPYENVMWLWVFAILKATSQRELKIQSHWASLQSYWIYLLTLKMPLSMWNCRVYNYFGIHSNGKYNLIGIICYCVKKLTIGTFTVMLLKIV